MDAGKNNGNCFRNMVQNVIREKCRECVCDDDEDDEKYWLWGPTGQACPTDKNQILVFTNLFPLQYQQSGHIHVKNYVVALLLLLLLTKYYTTKDGAYPL